MIYEMNLNPGPFKLIKSGKKTIEMRLYDDRRKNIKVDDEIWFTNTETKEILMVKVINLYRFNNFEELYAYFDKTKLGYEVDEIAKPSDMEIYYPKEKIDYFGVLGIEIALE